ncbi:MAG: hypothetical protein ACM3QS_05300 [Bacteroidota bacterium]
MPGVFEVSLPGEEPLGLAGPWQPVPPAAVSFDAGGAAAPPDVPVWRVNLPADPQEASQALSEAEAQLAAAESALRQVPARLEAVTSAGRAGGVSFDAGAAGAEPGSPEADLLELLGHVQAVERGESVSFGIGDIAGQAWEQARDQFGAFVAQIQREVLNLAWVETSAAMRLLARTSVDWSGDNNTVWLDGVDAQERELHGRALQVAIRTRLLRIRMFSTVTGGAAKLSLLLATPAGAVMALPVAWKYVAQILDQVKTYQTIARGGQDGK